jgi:hypothetical protein
MAEAKKRDPSRQPREGDKSKGAGKIGDRVLRYLVESRGNGDPDCTVDEVYRISGSASEDATSACLVRLKRMGLVQAGAARGQWQISAAGLKHVKAMGLHAVIGTARAQIAELSQDGGAADEING